MFTTPAATPVTIPAELMVAMAELLVVHVPPDGIAVSVIAEPAHTLLLPDIVAETFTDTVW